MLIFTPDDIHNVERFLQQNMRIDFSDAFISVEQKMMNDDILCITIHIHDDNFDDRIMLSYFLDANNSLLASSSSHPFYDQIIHIYQKIVNHYNAYDCAILQALSHVLLYKNVDNIINNLDSTITFQFFNSIKYVHDHQNFRQRSFSIDRDLYNFPILGPIVDPDKDYLIWFYQKIMLPLEYLKPSYAVPVNNNRITYTGHEWLRITAFLSSNEKESLSIFTKEHERIDSLLTAIMDILNTHKASQEFTLL